MPTLMERMKLQETTGYKPVQFFKEVLKTLERYSSVVFYDLETTGLGTNDRIIQFYGARYELPSFRPMNSLEVFIKQDDLLDPKIVELTGITDEFLEENGVDDDEAFQKIASFMSSDDLIMGHNIDTFDNRFMDAFYANHGEVFDYGDHLDTLKIAKKVVAPKRVTVYPKGLRSLVHNVIVSADDDTKKSISKTMDELYYTADFKTFVKKMEKAISSAGINADFDEFEQTAEKYKKKKPSYTNGILFHLYFPDVNVSFHNAAADVNANVAVFIAMVKEMQQAIDFDVLTANSAVANNEFKIIKISNYETATAKQTYVTTTPTGVFYYDADNLEWRAKEGSASIEAINMRELRNRVLKMAGATDEKDLFKQVKKLERYS